MANNSTNTDIESSDVSSINEVARLSRLAIGSRTLKEYADLSDLSEGFLSRLTTGKLKTVPTRRSLTKLAGNTSIVQNGITLADLMVAAGYEEPKEGTVKDRAEKLPKEIYSSSYISYMIASTLEMTNQIGHSYKTSNSIKMIIIDPEDKKPIVCIPAFGTSEDIDEVIKDAKWKLMISLGVMDDADAFFVIVTNQQELYDNFDKKKIPTIGRELYIALTGDLKRFIKQRRVLTKTIDGEDEKVIECAASYDLTKEV